MLKKEYMESFEAIFQEQYDTIHRLETNKLRNVARMFAHLLYTDSIPWSVSDSDGFQPTKRLFTCSQNAAAFNSIILFPNRFALKKVKTLLLLLSLL